MEIIVSILFYIALIWLLKFRTLKALIQAYIGPGVSICAAMIFIFVASIAMTVSTVSLGLHFVGIDQKTAVAVGIIIYFAFVCWWLYEKLLGLRRELRGLSITETLTIYFNSVVTTFRDELVKKWGKIAEDTETGLQTLASQGAERALNILHKKYRQALSDKPVYTFCFCILIVLAYNFYESIWPISNYDLDFFQRQYLGTTSFLLSWVAILTLACVIYVSIYDQKVRGLYHEIMSIVRYLNSDGKFVVLTNSNALKVLTKDPWDNQTSVYYYFVIDESKAAYWIKPDINPKHFKHIVTMANLYGVEGFLNILEERNAKELDS
jgi:hypothetical protein